MSKIRWLMLFLSLFYAPAMLGRSAEGDGDAMKEAESLYNNHCSVCHGEDGDGNSHARSGLYPPPKNFTVTGLASTLSRERMIQAIKNGIPNTAMSGWTSRLSDQQITALAGYIRSRFMNTSDQLGGGPADQSGEVARGAAVYSKTCSVCHGENGKGAVWGRVSLNPAPANFTDPLVQNRLSRSSMIDAVVHGRPGTAMTSFQRQLSDEDIAAVVDFIRTTFMNDVPAQNASTPAQVMEHAQSSDQSHALNHPHAHLTGDSVADAVMPKGLIGDPLAGQATYIENCTACHGAAGDGNGPRAYFIFPRPRNFIDVKTNVNLNRPHLFAAIKNGVVGREMPAWGKVLDDQHIADVAEYVFQSFVNHDSDQSPSRQVQ